jgi:hypothetical protein
MLGVRNLDPKQDPSFVTMMSGIVSVDHKISPWVILTKSKNFGEERSDERDMMPSVKFAAFS